MKPVRFPVLAARRGDRWKIDESQLQRYKLSSASCYCDRTRNIRSCPPYHERVNSKTPSPLSFSLSLSLFPPSPGLSNRTSRDYTSYPRHQIAINPFCRPALHNVSRSRSLRLFPVFLRYIRPRAIQDKTFSSLVLPAGSLNDRASPLVECTGLFCV